MATRNGNKIKDNFLTCSICFETYTDPCTLTCHHTFCQRCITKYIQTRPDAVQSKTIPCACCGQDTMVPHPSRPVEEWAGQIKPSIILQKLTHKPVLTNNCCTICQQLGEITAGVLWCPECEVDLCERCVKIHWVSPMSSDHDLFDLQTRDKGGKCKSDKPVPQIETTDHNNQGKGNLKAPLLVNTIDTYRISGQMSFNIRDVAVLDVDGVQTDVVTDGDNHCITSFYIRKKTSRFSTNRMKQSENTAEREAGTGCCPRIM
ncbi:uncharacterized protein LOC124128311 [Haliotis rufescens]|uniref:uncharacterized protein LOC124128311 n=1 Tax=Haliotis rufescens TaxID=6454 RepID=UPI00201F29F0|nr:uncharacterized protein LOC124128311 [Haliotis rufescens]